MRGKDAPSQLPAGEAAAGADDNDDSDVADEGNWQSTLVGWEMLDWHTMTSDDSWTCCMSPGCQLMLHGDELDSDHNEFYTPSTHRHRCTQQRNQK